MTKFQSERNNRRFFLSSDDFPTYEDCCSCWMNKLFKRTRKKKNWSLSREKDEFDENENKQSLVPISSISMIDFPSIGKRNRISLWSNHCKLSYVRFSGDVNILRRLSHILDNDHSSKAREKRNVCVNKDYSSISFRHTLVNEQNHANGILLFSLEFVYEQRKLSRLDTAVANKQCICFWYTDVDIFCW